VSISLLATEIWTPELWGISPEEWNKNLIMIIDYGRNGLHGLWYYGLHTLLWIAHSSFYSINYVWVLPIELHTNVQFGQCRATREQLLKMSLFNPPMEDILFSKTQVPMGWDWRDEDETSADVGFSGPKTHNFPKLQRLFRLQGSNSAINFLIKREHWSGHASVSFWPNWVEGFS